jgi:hypothetical protein
MTIRGFFNIVYYTTILEAPGRHFTHILPPLECTCQYPYLYYSVAITRYLTSKNSKIGR